MTTHRTSYSPQRATAKTDHRLGRSVRISDAECADTPEAARPESLQSISGERLLTVRDAANVLRLSESWLAKARMRGDGPPFVKIGRSIRYGESALRDWVKSQTRRSTSEQ